MIVYVRGKIKDISASNAMEIISFKATDSHTSQ